MLLTPKTKINLLSPHQETFNSILVLLNGSLSDTHEETKDATSEV